MAEDNDYTPDPHWKGHDFSKARSSYDADAGRGYADAKAKGKTNNDLLPKRLTTDSSAPLVIVTDVTGSMGDWPGVIFSKLPYLDHECRTQYLGEDMEISYAGFDDVKVQHEYPVQARPFAKGKDLTKRVKELVHTGNGGGNGGESAELIALYYARNVFFPKAIRTPIVIFTTDEPAHTYISPSDAALVHVKTAEAITAKAAFAELKEKCAVYVILKGDDSSDSSPGSLRKNWLQYVDAAHIAVLPEAERVVDVIFGILAKEADMIDYFQGEIEDRQKPDQVATVYKSLKTVHALSADAGGKKTTGKSRMKGLGAGKKTKKLDTD